MDFKKGPFSYRYGMPWYDFLQARRISDEVSLALRETSRENAEAISQAFKDELEGTFSEISSLSLTISRETLDRLDLLDANILDGLSQMSDKIQNLNRLVSGLGALVNEAFKRIILHLETQSKNLADILATLQNPRKTQAMEYKNRGLIALKNGWIDEAVEDFSKSIEENYQDFSVYFHLGDIYLYEGGKSEDLDQALDYFLKAARYAEPYDKYFRGRALYFAGFVLYLKQDLVGAIKKTEESLNLNPDDFEATYQLSKLLALKGQKDESISYLRKAILGDRNYALKVTIDHDFDKLRNDVDKLISDLRDEVKTRVEGIKNELLRRLEKIKSHPYAGELTDQIGTIEQRLAEAEKYLGFNTYIDALQVEESLNKIESMVIALEKEIKDFEEKEKAKVKALFDNLCNIASEIKNGRFFEKFPHEIKQKIKEIENNLEPGQNLLSCGSFEEVLRYFSTLSLLLSKLEALKKESEILERKFRKEEVRAIEERRIRTEKENKEKQLEEKKELFFWNLKRVPLMWLIYSSLGVLIAFFLLMVAIIKGELGDFRTWLFYGGISGSIGFLLTMMDVLKGVGKYLRETKELRREILKIDKKLNYEFIKEEVV